MKHILKVLNHKYQFIVKMLLKLKFLAKLVYKLIVPNVFAQR